MSREPLIVTLDGPAGSGKSAVARLLADRLGLEFLDTGAMYRALTAACCDAGIDPGDVQAVEQVVRQVTLRFDWKADPPRLHLDGRDMTDRLRDSDVTGSVSQVAAIAAVREVMVSAQRAIGLDHPRLVTEGRDQGSVVFPGAQRKFYLDASPQVRAQRRADQLRAVGRQADEKEILEHIHERDYRDSHRDIAPLICPDDAQRVDTSDMTLAEVVDFLERCVREQAA